MAGSGEFYLQQQGSDDVKLVVRTINSSAFTPHDWEEYVVSVRPVPITFFRYPPLWLQRKMEADA